MLPTGADFAVTIVYNQTFEREGPGYVFHNSRRNPA